MASNKRTLSIRKGDQVKVIAGADKGVEGKVIEVLAERERVIVEGVNRIKRHTRAGADGTQGGIITREAPIHVSNVMLLDPTDNKPTRVGIRVNDDGTRQRYSKRSGEVV